MTTHDEKLDRLLKSLPREPARENFTIRVMERLESRRPFAFSPVKIALFSAAATAALAMALSTVSYVRQRAEQKLLRQELMSVKSEYREIARQMEALRSQSPQASVLYVGGDDKADYVMDISKLRIRLTGREPPPSVPEGSALFEIDPTNPLTYPSAGVIQANYPGGSI